MATIWQRIKIAYHVLTCDRVEYAVYVAAKLAIIFIKSGVEINSIDILGNREFD